MVLPLIAVCATVVAVTAILTGSSVHAEVDCNKDGVRAAVDIKPSK